MKKKIYPYLDDLHGLRANELHQERDFTAGRIGVALAIVSFICLYFYIIIAYGILAGIAVGWLPSLIIAWATALLTSRLLKSNFRIAPR